MIEPDRCRHCGGVNIALRRQGMCNGNYHIAWRCLECDRWAIEGAHWISRAELAERFPGLDLETIPMIEGELRECAVCGMPAEEHHIAPRALAYWFGPEWGRWPTIYLCRRHHLMWHRYVTPGLVVEFGAAL